MVQDRVYATTLRFPLPVGVGARVGSIARRARTRYYRARTRTFVTWNADVEVHGRIELRGPGRIVIGEQCVFEQGAPNIIRAEARDSTVVLRDRCRLSGLDIRTTGHVTIGADARIRLLRIDGEGTVALGDGCEFDQGSGGNAIHALHRGVSVDIGAGCYLNGLDVFATDDTTIGDRCIIGLCSMATTDFHSTRADRWSPAAPVRHGPIAIGENVWIAARTVVTKGVTIGDNSVVSIGTVVRDDVPANVIVSSHEQRIVKQLPNR